MNKKKISKKKKRMLAWHVCTGYFHKCPLIRKLHILFDKIEWIFEKEAMKCRREQKIKFVSCSVATSKFLHFLNSFVSELANWLHLSVLSLIIKFCLLWVFSHCWSLWTIVYFFLLYFYSFKVNIPKRCLPFYNNNWRHSSTAARNFRAILLKQLDDIHLAGTYKNERVITSPQKTAINIEGSSKSVVNFCANNYLGLSVSPF